MSDTAAAEKSEIKEGCPGEHQDVKKEEGDQEWEVVDAAPAAGGLEPGSELDLCFICDCTGSMGAYIKAAQANITTIVDKISTEHGAGVRFGLISYRDHPPQEMTYVTKVFKFTEDRSKMRASVNSMSASGGGDGPEAVTAGLYKALHMPWRPNATKVCVLIADAPPHGLEPRGDGFPNGDPDGRDPLEIAHEMVVQNITVYTVGCEPALSQYQFARDFLCSLADITSGQAVALSSASLLADVIINGSAEELGLAKLQQQVEQEIVKVQQDAKEKKMEMSTEEAIDVAWGNLQRGGMECMQMETDGRMVNRTQAYWGGGELGPKKKTKSLAEVKASLCKAFPAAAAASAPLGRSSRIPAAAVTLKKKKLSAAPSLRSRRSASPVKLAEEEAVRCEEAEDDVLDELVDKDFCSTPSKSVPLEGLTSLSPAAAVAGPASTNIIKKGLISKDQVSRIANRALCQKRL